MTEKIQKIERVGRLRWVPLAKMKVLPVAQRVLKQYWVDHLAADLDLERIGTPTVNERDGLFYLVDGQHRVEALRQIGWGDQQIQCWTYVDLTDQEMADMFDRLNDNLAVQSLDTFRVRVTAGREVETDIDRVVRAQGCVVSRDKVPGGIGAVGTLRKVYTRSDPATLGRTLRIIRDAYGDAGFSSPVIDGLGHLCARYNGDLDDDQAIFKLGSAHGGVSGLLNKAELLRRQTGNYKSHCVAAAAVEIINQGKGGKKLPSWFKAAA